jgi:hypothetical protein
MMKKILIMAALTLVAGPVLISLQGCAGLVVPGTEREGENIAADQGGAGYTYERREIDHPDGRKEKVTKLQSTSQRDVTDASLTILNDGSMEASVSKTAGNEQAAQIVTSTVNAVAGTINKALDKVPGGSATPAAPVPAPAPAPATGSTLIPITR